MNITWNALVVITVGITGITRSGDLDVVWLCLLCLYLVHENIKGQERLQSLNKRASMVITELNKTVRGAHRILDDYKIIRGRRK